MAFSSRSSSHSSFSHYGSSGHSSAPFPEPDFDFTTLIIPSLVLAAVFFFYSRIRQLPHKTSLIKFMLIWAGMVVIYLLENYGRTVWFDARGHSNYMLVGPLLGFAAYIVARMTREQWPTQVDASIGRLLFQAIVAFMIPVHIIPMLAVFIDIRSIWQTIFPYWVQAVCVPLFVVLFYVQHRIYQHWSAKLFSDKSEATKALVKKRADWGVTGFLIITPMAIILIPLIMPFLFLPVLWLSGLYRAISDGMMLVLG
ncbi:hypothetical protein R2R70_18580 [Cobetia sp. SIMBA_158]|uniref:hypothetical protein n=2 Tax=Bacteria TaxID=2 RepID=UPI00398152E9